MKKGWNWWEKRVGKVKKRVGEKGRARSAKVHKSTCQLYRLSFEEMGQKCPPDPPVRHGDVDSLHLGGKLRGKVELKGYI